MPIFVSNSLGGGSGGGAAGPSIYIVYAAQQFYSWDSNLNTFPNIYDGVPLYEGALVLALVAAGMGDGPDGGIYRVVSVGTGSDGVWERVADLDTYQKLNGLNIVKVNSGSANGGATWVHTTAGKLTSDTSPVSFSKILSPRQRSYSETITVTNSDLNTTIWGSYIHANRDMFAVELAVCPSRIITAGFISVSLWKSDGLGGPETRLPGSLNPAASYSNPYGTINSTYTLDPDCLIPYDWLVRTKIEVTNAVAPVPVRIMVTSSFQSQSQF